MNQCGAQDPIFHRPRKLKHQLTIFHHDLSLVWLHIYHPSATVQMLLFLPPVLKQLEMVEVFCLTEAQTHDKSAPSDFTMNRCPLRNQQNRRRLQKLPQGLRGVSRSLPAEKAGVGRSLGKHSFCDICIILPGGNV